MDTTNLLTVLAMGEGMESRFDPVIGVCGVALVLYVAFFVRYPRRNLKTLIDSTFANSGTTGWRLRFRQFTVAVLFVALVLLVYSGMDTLLRTLTSRR